MNFSHTGEKERYRREERSNYITDSLLEDVMDENCV